jgi:hypothetical protein
MMACGELGSSIAGELLVARLLRWNSALARTSGQQQPCRHQGACERRPKQLHHPQPHPFWSEASPRFASPIPLLSPELIVNLREPIAVAKRLSSP